jgi:transcriptional regulator with XRE-family HTH domain
MTRLFPVLCAEARRRMHVNQRQFAEAVGSSLRTVQRWETSRSSPVPAAIHRVADAVRPHDASLAAELDALSPRPAPPASLVTPPASPERPPLTDAILLDALVCAAAEAMGLAPQTLRPALLAAFTRAKATGLTIDAVIAGLTPSA